VCGYGYGSELDQETLICFTFTCWSSADDWFTRASVVTVSNRVIARLLGAPSVTTHCVSMLFVSLFEVMETAHRIC
jgi:hypothetical protein